MNIKEIIKQAGISYPTIRAFVTGKDSIKLGTFKKLVSDTDLKELKAMIERTKNRIKRESGRRSL